MISHETILCKRNVRFTSREVGCWADGTFGHEHVRAVLADLVEKCWPECAKALRGPMSDDAWEEDAALDALNEHTDEPYTWEFDGGDLFLWDTTKDT